MTSFGTWKSSSTRSSSPRNRGNLDIRNSENSFSRISSERGLRAKASFETFRNELLRKHLSSDLISSTSTKKEKVELILNSAILESAVCGLAFIDFAILVYDVESRATQGKGPGWMDPLNTTFQTLFLAEAILRAWIMGRGLFVTPWILCDMLVVLLNFVGACVWGAQSPLRILRIFRLILIFTRINEKLSSIPSLSLLIGTIIHSLKLFVCGTFLYFLNLLAFSVLAMEFLQAGREDDLQNEDMVERFGERAVQESCNAFSSLLSSMVTFVALSIGDRWHEVAVPIISTTPWACVIFFAYVLMTSIVIVGSILTAMQTSQRQAEQQDQLLKKLERDKEKTRALHSLQNMFDLIDSDKSGAITWQEFYHNAQHNPDFLQIMDTLDLSIDDLEQLFSLLDSDESGEISDTEFMNLMWRIQSDELKFTLMTTAQKTDAISTRIEEHNRKARNGLDTIQADVRDVQGDITLIHAALKEIIDKLADRHSLVPREAAAEETAVETKGSQRKSSSVAEYMRGVCACDIALYNSPTVMDFWESAASPDEALLAAQMAKVDFFVSHCWPKPKCWNEHFKRNRKTDGYAYKKVLALNNVITAIRSTVAVEKSTAVSKSTRFKLSDVSSMSSRRLSSTYNAPHPMKDVYVWMDKACIPQNNPKEKQVCIGLIEEFLKRSDGMIVLLSWQYFTRLWCLYEWACFLRLHQPQDLHIGCDAFLKVNATETLPLYIESIRTISVRHTQCHNPNDRTILEEKVYLYYKGDTPAESFASFERFARISAILLMSKEIAIWRARTSTGDEQAWLGPMRRLAEEMGFDELAGVLRDLQPALWFSQCDEDHQSFQQLVRCWFEKVAVYLLLKEGTSAVREKYKPVTGGVQSSDVFLPERSLVSNLSERYWLSNQESDASSAEPCQPVAENTEAQERPVTTLAGISRGSPEREWNDFRAPSESSLESPRIMCRRP